MSDRPVCVGPGRKPHCWFSYDAAQIVIEFRGYKDSNFYSTDMTGGMAQANNMMSQTMGAPGMFNMGTSQALQNQALQNQALQSQALQNQFQQQVALQQVG